MFAVRANRADEEGRRETPKGEDEDEKDRSG
jgi:hypothetical protein